MKGFPMTDNRQTSPFPYHIPPTAAQTEEELEYAILFRDYIHELLKELSFRYAKDDLFDVYPAKYRPRGFRDKTPVWLIWWQGEDKMPDLVKLCVNSIRHAIPGDLAEIYFITEANFRDYVHFPPRILELFQKGSITITHLTDLIRAELLYRYGGFYIDATFLVRQPMPKQWFLPDAFYTPKLDPPDPQFVSQGLWFGNFIKTGAGDILPRYLINAFYLYWSEQEILADYFLIDIIIAEAVRSVPAIADKILGNPPSMPHIEHLVHNLNDPYDEAVDRILQEDTFVYKLTWKLPFEKQTPDGRETLYGHICREIEKNGDIVAHGREE